MSLIKESLPSNWVERFPEAELLRMRSDLPRHVWVREYLCKPMKAGETKLDVEWLHLMTPKEIDYYHEKKRKSEFVRVMGVDPVWLKEEVKITRQKLPDYMGIAIVDYWWGINLWITRYLMHKRGTFTQQCDEVKKVANMFHPHYCVIETNMRQDAMYDVLRKQSEITNWRDFEQHKNKTVRIAQMEVPLRKDRCYFVNIPDWWLEEYSSFPNGEFDDGLDAWHLASMKAQLIGKGKGAKGFWV